MTCDTCRHWKRLKPYVLEELGDDPRLDDGICRRYPPVREAGRGPFGYFPRTNAWQSCGEYSEGEPDASE